MADRLVKVMNNTNGELGIQLNSGTYISLTQFRTGKTSHISKAVQFDDLPESVTKKNGMLARKMVSVIDA
jgi:hypothetical protein